ncbi:hypothetical protein H5410_010719 [Solanum commersonii]|uniref:Uncharacterized protein n=1 Tax=Solanum commersonii TaxID=4109 RepID=A0A9J6ALH8_SOLCO|nr:hypothetical protein H5410_010719 [Solanum commersonii]
MGTCPSLICHRSGSGRDTVIDLPSTFKVLLYISSVPQQNCLKQSQPTPPGLCNVLSIPLAACQNTPLLFGPLQPEMTPKVGAAFPKTNTSHPSTVSCKKVLVAQKLNKDLVSSTRISAEHPSLEHPSSSPVSFTFLNK